MRRDQLEKKLGLYFSLPMSRKKTHTINQSITNDQFSLIATSDRAPYLFDVTSNARKITTEKDNL